DNYIHRVDHHRDLHSFPTRRSSDLGSIGSVMKPAGFENAQGIISSTYLKDPTDPQWKNDPGMKAWNEFLDKYYPEANRADASVRSEEHTSELQSRSDLVCRLLLEKK